MVTLFLDAPDAQDYPFTSPSKSFMHFAKQRGPSRIVRFLLPIISCLFLSPPPALCQDSGGEGIVPRGNRAEIAVTVRDSSGEPAFAPSTGQRYRRGAPIA